ncbi:MAG TPA: DEAD/DEAH box helicase family protein [Pyrinomonadaceae bacterium]|nr:DEAD/DEAH box helicase family protein [Pyrinomonadaceae bacterium]
MKIELKGFQERAAVQMLNRLESARRDVLRGEPQAMILSSPTGSGKTVTVTALMEWIVAGYESYPDDRDATFLWLSDSPELNAQSRDKILQHSSVFLSHDVVIIDPTFTQEQFEGGKIYFLNTQKLGKESLLTKRGDMREYAIWETIENTTKANPANFYVIIDEAHRGMIEKRGERKKAQTIVQRFIKGYDEAGMEPLKLIIGMSATPEKFHTIVKGTGRAIREIEIDIQEVKASGLLKDKITLFHPAKKQPSDWTLLENATRRWKSFRTAWKKYCTAQRMEHIIEPVLVIQVENAVGKQLTATPLEKVVEVVERDGKLSEKAWAHAFQEEGTIQANGQTIRKIEQSKIESDSDVRVVLFKMSLTTGWDCPRAEVMMSFRKAVDSTLIAQLVGRMVRTPLARRIEGNEFLNKVSLYLPHYDESGLEKIVKQLNEGDPEIGAAVEVEEGVDLISLIRDPDKAELFNKLEKLPSYYVERITKTSDIRRLIKLARLLAFDEIEIKELDRAKKLIVQTLSNELTRLRKQSAFVDEVSANRNLELREVEIQYGEWIAESATTKKVPASPENIEDLFVDCGRKLGEGLHLEFWKSKKHEHDDALLAKLQLFQILQDRQAWKKLEQASKERIADLFKKYNDDINDLRSSRREEYRKVKGQAKEPIEDHITLPDDGEIEIKEERPLWQKHLLIDEKSGKFGAKFNSWETSVLKDELAKEEVVGWFRNVPRKSWAVCVPYEMHGTYKPFYPDFIVFRKYKKKIVADILDPHESGLADAVDKAKGLAQYARKHAGAFGRIELIVIDKDGNRLPLDLTKEAVRDKVLRLSGKNHLDQLFADS